MKPAASRLKALLARAVLLVALVPALRAGEPLCVWKGIDRVVAVGDLHGDYEGFVKILRGTGVLDKKHSWTGGNAHLVQIGDIMDRGPGAKRIFDLLRRLEKEARRAGGMVHVLLGNHEELNITGIVFDYPDYVTVEQFVSFLPRIYRREKENELLKSLRGAYTHKPQEEVDAEMKRRLGEYWMKIMKTDAGRRAYIDGFNGTYGRWLLEKNAVIQINGTVFVHGGISEKYSTWKLEDINGLLRRELAFYSGRHRARLKTAEPFEPLIVYDAKGPLWFRDLATGEAGEVRKAFDRIMKNLGADSMVIAHTVYRGDGVSPVVSPRTMSRFDGRLWTIDTGISDFYGGIKSALVIEQGSFVLWGDSTDLNDSENAPPPDEAAVPEGPDMEEFLRTAPIEAVIRRGQPGRTEPWTVVLADGESACKAIFKYVDRRRPSVLPDNYKYELAAYEVARELGLDIVPVVVERKIEGRPGSLQLLVEEAVSERTRRAKGLNPPDPAALRDRLEAVRVFALLVDDECEDLEDTFVDTRTWEVHRVDFSEAFGLSPDPRPGCLPETVPEGLLPKLKHLDDELLAKHLSRYLDKKEIRALVLRKSKIIPLLEGLGH
jgi:Calcineurin-like phosphoesterase